MYRSFLLKIIHARQPKETLNINCRSKLTAEMLLQKGSLVNIFCFSCRLGHDVIHVQGVSSDVYMNMKNAD